MLCQGGGKPPHSKVGSGNSLPDYLQTELWFTRKMATLLSCQPIESHISLNLQFADMLAGLVQSRFEDDEMECFGVLSPHITMATLYFGK
ncbi:MAG TPA: hypothetical protein VGD60_05135 [Candidatus Acidoferrales bacterium]